MKVLENKRIQQLFKIFITVFNIVFFYPHFFPLPANILARLNDPLLYNCLFHHQFLFHLPFHSNEGTQEKCDHCRKKEELIYSLHVLPLAISQKRHPVSKTKDPCKLRTENA